MRSKLISCEMCGRRRFAVIASDRCGKCRRSRGIRSATFRRICDVAPPPEVDPGREGRIATYAARAALGLPLFGGQP